MVYAGLNGLPTAKDMCERNNHLLRIDFPIFIIQVSPLQILGTFGVIFSIFFSSFCDEIRESKQNNPR